MQLIFFAAHGDFDNLTKRKKTAGFKITAITKFIMVINYHFISNLLKSRDSVVGYKMSLIFLQFDRFL